MNTPAQCGVIKPPKTDIYSEAPHLRQACDEEGSQEFLFTAGPLRLLRGTGSPANPIAVF